MALPVLRFPVVYVDARGDALMACAPYTAMMSGGVGFVARGRPELIRLMLARVRELHMPVAGVVTDAGVFWCSTDVEWSFEEMERA